MEQKVEQNNPLLENPLLENPLLKKVEQNVVENNPLLKEELSVEEKMRRIQEGNGYTQVNTYEYSKLFDKAAFVSSYHKEEVPSVEAFSSDDINRMSYCVY